MNTVLKSLGVAALSLTMLASPLWAQSGNQLPSNLKTTTESIIGGQITAFKAQQHEKAFGYASPTLRDMFKTTDNFIKMVRSGYGAIYGARNWSFGRAQAVSGTIYQEVLIEGPAGRNWVALYTLSKQADGSWKISAVQLKKGEALST